jgi:hypothetical protein
VGGLVGDAVDATLVGMAYVDCWEAVADRHGLLSTGDALTAGVTSRELAAMVKDGRLVHLGRGWYSLPFPESTEDVTPWRRRRVLHAARARAAVRAVGGRATASHHTALVLEDLPVFAADLRQVHLPRLDDVLSRRRPGLTVHGRVVGAFGRDGVIDVATAVVQSGVVNGPMAALIAADAALHRELVDLDQLAEAGDRVLGPRTRAVRSMLRFADPRAESPGETRLRCALRLMGYDAVPQFRIVDGSFVAVVDFLLAGRRVVVEFDGFVKYGRRSPLTLGAAPADGVTAEKVREDHVRELDDGFVRVTWPDLDAIRALHRRIEAVVERSAPWTG